MFKKKKNKLCLEKKVIIRSKCNEIDYYYNNIIIILEKDNIYYHPKYSKIYPSSEYRSNIIFNHIYGLYGLNYKNNYFNLDNITLNKSNNKFLYKTDYGNNLVYLTENGYDKLYKYINNIKIYSTIKKIDLF
jgi:hypothetical protein